MGMLSDGGSLAHMQLGALSQHVAAVRHAMGALQGPGRLPAHLLFSDRDFDENDYEALLALDDSVVSRKGKFPVHSSTSPSLPVFVIDFDSKQSSPWLESWKDCHQLKSFGQAPKPACCLTLEEAALT